jgi:hypothetical protein
MDTKVKVGLSTVLGVLATLGAFAAAITAYKQGDRSEQTLGTIAGTVVGVISLVTTMAGRFAQAHKIAGHQLDDETANIIAQHVEDTMAGQLADDDGPGEDAPPQAELYPLDDPREVPADEGDAGSRGAEA